MFRRLLPLSRIVAPSRSAFVGRVLARGIKTRVTDLKPGHVLEIGGKLLAVVSLQRANTAQRSAFFQAELRDVKTGVKTKERFRSEESVERADMADKQYSFLYSDKSTCTLLQPESFEQIELPMSLVGDQAPFLEEGLPVRVSFHNDAPIVVQLPERVVCEVADTSPAGDQAAASYKPATLTNGVRVMVPPFIAKGERIVVRTDDRTYVERAAA